MLNTFITYLQIFGIGFSFGLAGPCLLTCAPVLITYITGNRTRPPASGVRAGWAEIFKDIFMFLSGRLLAYVLLGALAGLSGAALKKFTGGSLSSYLQPLAGAVTILFAVILFMGKDSVCCDKVLTARGNILNFGGIFAFGFLIGISPCAPLLALLFNITIMSKGLFGGIFYMFFFGLGTFLSGLITIGVITGILTRVPTAFIESKTANIVFKVICAALLMMLGLGLVFRLRI